jgi:hypothetical protein
MEPYRLDVSAQRGARLQITGSFMASASGPPSAPATKKVCRFFGGSFESGCVSTPTPLLLRTMPPVDDTIVMP